MLNKKIILPGLAVLLLGGCAKKYDLVSLESSAAQPISFEQAQATVVATEPAISETEGETSENAQSIIIETAETTKKDPFANALYGIKEVEVYEYGANPNALSDVYRVGYLPSDAYNKDGIISNFKLYDTKNDMWLAVYDIDTEEEHQARLTSVSAITLDTYNTSVAFSYEKNTENPLTYSTISIGTDLWMMINNPSTGITTAYNYNGSAQKRGALSFPLNSEGVFRDGTDAFYYAQDGSLMYTAPNLNGKALALGLDKDFKVERVSGIFDYPSGVSWTIVRGKDEDNEDTTAVIGLDSGKVVFEGDIDYYVECNDSRLILRSFYDGTNGQIRFYHSSYPDVVYSSSAELHAQLLSDGSILIYYVGTYAEGISSIYVYRYNKNHTLLANTRFEVFVGSEIAGEAVLKNDGHIVFPMAVDGSVTFYEWSGDLQHPDLGLLNVDTVTDTERYSLEDDSEEDKESEEYEESEEYDEYDDESDYYDDEEYGE